MCIIYTRMLWWNFVMNQDATLSLQKIEDIKKYIDGAFCGTIHDKRVASLANATIGIMI